MVTLSGKKMLGLFLLCGTASEGSDGNKENLAQTRNHSDGNVAEGLEAECKRKVGSQTRSCMSDTTELAIQHCGVDRRHMLL